LPTLFVTLDIYQLSPIITFSTQGVYNSWRSWKSTGI